MDTLEAIHTRRSIRKFKDQPVSEDLIDGFKELVGLPEKVMAHTLIPIGFSAQKLSREDRFKKERIHYNRW